MMKQDAVPILYRLCAAEGNESTEPYHFLSRTKSTNELRKDESRNSSGTRHDMCPMPTSQAKRMKRLKELLVPLKIEKKMFSPLLLSSPATPMERFGHARVGQL